MIFEISANNLDPARIVGGLFKKTENCMPLKWIVSSFVTKPDRDNLTKRN
jgi:hypothetical protein